MYQLEHPLLAALVSTPRRATQRAVRSTGTALEVDRLSA